ncbi:Lrp/AsnC family transcriptional regulator, partial [Candidatus Woesearchaeota archaeon]|nr:Lrp/AsnC family transcriptional regulator [Candidatus Woesearchaeota archaeon]
PYVRAIIQFNGKYDLELALVAKNISDCDRVTSLVLQDCQSFLQHHEVLFITKTFVANTFPKSFYTCQEPPAKARRREMITRYNTEEHVVLEHLGNPCAPPTSSSKWIPRNGFPMFEEQQPKNTTGEADVDDKDIAILELLSENATIPVHTIAAKVRLSGDAVTYRIKKLQKARYIISYVPAINYSLINYNIHSLLIRLSHLTEKEEASLQEFLRTNRDVLWAVKTLGRYNILLYLCTQTMDDFTTTTEAIRNFLVNKIQDYEILINFEEYKYTYLPKGLLI